MDKSHLCLKFDYHNPVFRPLSQRFKHCQQKAMLIGRRMISKSDQFLIIQHEEWHLICNICINFFPQNLTRDGPGGVVLLNLP